jgi:hypothetical protein
MGSQIDASSIGIVHYLITDKTRTTSLTAEAINARIWISFKSVTVARHFLF